MKVAAARKRRGKSRRGRSVMYGQIHPLCQREEEEIAREVERGDKEGEGRWRSSFTPPPSPLPYPPGLTQPASHPSRDQVGRPPPRSVSVCKKNPLLAPSPPLQKGRETGGGGRGPEKLQKGKEAEEEEGKSGVGLVALEVAEGRGGGGGRGTS